MNDVDAQEQGRYLYCVTRGDAGGGLELTGLDDQPISLVSAGGLGVVVSPSPVKRYRLSRQYTLAHEAVIEQAMACGTVLPVKFGTVAESEEAIRRVLLNEHSQELSRLLVAMDGKVEMGVKVFWDSERIYADILERNTLIRHLRDQIAARPASETHYDRIRLGQMVETALTSRRQADADYIMDRLAAFAADSRSGSIYGDTMILNASFLVESSKEQEFDDAVHSLDRDLAGLVSIKYVGPLPPFNFVDLAISWN